METTEYKYTFDKVGNIIRRDEYRNTMYVGSTVIDYLQVIYNHKHVLRSRTIFYYFIL
jgi:hypothetical protein